MKLLVTGAYGQLGSEMRVALEQYPELESVLTDADVLDITDLVSLEAFVLAHRPNVLVNCAAYTAVDKAEDDAETCKRINVDAVRNIGTLAQKYGFQVIHISTDYVFDGHSYMPYTEEMMVNPTNVYGKTKLQGEQVLMSVNPSAIILRTSWLYSSFGNNFVKTMIRLGRERSELSVIFDQVGTPTYAADLAKAILTIIEKREFVPGVYHYSNEGVCSWYDFAIAIHKLAGIECHVAPIESADYAVRTPRPFYSVLNKKKIKSTYGVEIPHWMASLERCVAILLKD